MSIDSAVIDDFVVMVIEANATRGLTKAEQVYSRQARDIVNMTAAALKSEDTRESEGLINAMALSYAMYMATNDPANDEKFIALLGDLIREKAKLMRPLLGHLILQKILPDGETASAFLRELRAAIARTEPKP
jgi:hypothetical protein